MDNKSARKSRFVSAQSALTRWVSLALMTLGSLSAVNVAQAQTPTTAELLSGVVGTYNLTFFDADANADNNRGLVATPPSRVRFIIAAGGRLCTPDLNLTQGVASSNPLARNGAVLWTNAFADLQINLRVVDNNADQVYEFQEIDYRSATGAPVGRFSLAAPGDFTAGTGTCGASNDATPAQINTFFTSAEATFGALFPSGPFTFTQIAAGSSFRYYDSTGITLAVTAGQVYAKGGGYGTDYVAVGSFEDLTRPGGINNIIRPASIGAFFAGTYLTAMSDPQPFSPIPDGTEVRYVITSSGQLCLSNRKEIFNPLILNNNSNFVAWIDTVQQRSYQQRVTRVNPDTPIDPGIGLLQVFSLSNFLYGALVGVRTSLDAFCTDLDPQHPDTVRAPRIEKLFEVKEQLFPELYPASPIVQTQRTAQFTFRFYPQTNRFIAVSSGIVYEGSGAVSVAGVSSGGLEQVISATTAATSPYLPASFMVGTYDMVVSGASPLSTAPNGTRVRMVLTSNGTLCVDNVALTSPTAPRSALSDVSWTNMQVGLNAFMVVPTTQSAVTVHLTSSFGDSFGRLDGSRVNTRATCTSAAPSAAEIAAAEEYFILAERKFPQLLPTQSAKVDRTVSGAITRLYRSTDVTVSIIAGEVFARGGSFGANDVVVGNLTTLLPELRAEVGQATKAAVIPSSLWGTYEMLVSGANPLAPFANNSRARVVLRTDGSLCINNVISNNPRSDYASPQLLRWTNSESQLIANLDVSDTSTAVVVSLQNTAGASQGTLTGNRISNDTFCSTETPGTSALQLINELFLLAERQYPDLLPAGNNITQTSGPAVSRRYNGNGLVLTVVNNQIFARGAEFGSADVAVGNLQTQLAGLRELVGEDNKASVIPPALIGTYDMLVNNSNLTAQFANGIRVRVVVRQNGELCLNSLISSNPRSDYGSLQIANWTFPTSNFVAVANTADLTDGLVFSLRNTAGSTLATLTGDRISTDTFCSATALTAAQVQTVNELFMLAERQYPSQLVTSGSNTLTTGPAVRRNYPGGLILTVVDNKVFARGGEFGLTDINVGPLDALLTELRSLVGADNRAAVIPAALAGTYDLLVSGANPFAPFANNSRMRVVLNTNGDLCLNSTIINNPRSDYGSVNIATWTQSAAGIIARLNMTDVNEGLIVQLSSTAGNSLGTLTGTRVNTDVFCSAVALTASEAQSVNNLIALAERRSPTLFSSDPNNSTLNAGGAVWKTYAGTNTVLSVVNNRVFARGGSFGATDFYLGTVPALTSQWLAEVGPPPAQIAQYNIRVTGNAVVTITGMNPVTRLLNINQKQTYSLTELVDNNLPNIARALLSGEISSPDSIVIADVSRSNGVLYFKATLIKTTAVGSTTTTRRIEAQITLSL
jgi:hypothetical protein